MSHAPLSVIVLASGSTSTFTAHLDALRATLGVRDEVVCVVDPANRAHAESLARQRWLTRIVASPAGEAAGQRWQSGVDATSHPVVVLLDGDVLVSAHWLDTIAEPFADPQVVAVGPRCHGSFGPQQVTLPAEAGSTRQAFKDHARQWRRDNNSPPRAVDRLGPVVFAVRRDALAAAGGPSLDQPYDRLRQLGTLVVAERALTLHIGGATCALRPQVSTTDQPLISASMIVKDEEAAIAGTVAAVLPFVDEVVVYDTGSVDRTRQVAADAGARVVAGYWNDHFADARNRSLDECRGRWALIVDADEIVSGDPDRVREQVRATGRDALSCAVISENSGGGSATLWSSRLIRREAVRWDRRVHELPFDRITGRPVPEDECRSLTFQHSGYTATRVVERDKPARNLALARANVSDNPADPTALRHLARSYILAGDLDGAVEACEAALAAHPSAADRVLVLTTYIDSLQAAGRRADADSALAQLAELDPSPATLMPLQAAAALAHGEFVSVLELVAAFPDGQIDDRNNQRYRSELAPLEMSALTALGRRDEAVERLSHWLRGGVAPVPADQLLELVGSERVAALLPMSDFRSLIRTLLQAEPGDADRILEAFADRYPDHPVVVAVAAPIAPKLPNDRATVWSRRLRAVGLARECPLIVRAADPELPVRDRVGAAAIALSEFADDRAMALLERALAEVPADEHDAVVGDLRQTAPQIARALESI